jgi:uncharacterized membrane protein YgcG
MSLKTACETDSKTFLKPRVLRISILHGVKNQNQRRLNRAKARSKKNLSQNFDGTFTKVRAKVVKEQEAKLEKFATPETPQDYLNVEKKSPELHTDLMKRSIKLYSEPLFSENKKILSKKISDIINEARRQYDEQHSIVVESRGVGDNDITVDSIKKALLGEIERFRQQLKNPYKIFPSVQDMLVPASKQIASSKFDRWVTSWSFLVPREEIQRQISEDSVLHRQKSQSKQALLTFFRPGIQKKIFGDYLGGLTSNDRQALRKFLENQPAFESQISLAVEKSLKHFHDAREMVSSAQYNRYFPMLADSTWKLDETAIQKRYRMDTTKDNQRILQKFLTGKQVIAETDQLVAVAVAKLAARGDAAIKGQMTLADRYRARAKNNIEQLFAGIANTKLNAKQFINNLVTTATADIQQLWSAKALARDYPQLFQMVKDKIRKDIKDLIPIELKRREKAREDERKRKDDEEIRIKKEKEKEIEQLAEQKKKEKETTGAPTGEGGTATGPGTGTSDGPGEGKSEGPSGGGGGKDSGGGGGGGSGAGFGPGSGGGLEKLEPDAIIDIDIVKKNEVKVSVKLIKGEPYEFTFSLWYKDYNKYHDKVKSNLENVEERFKDYLSNKAQSRGLTKSISLLEFII